MFAMVLLIDGNVEGAKDKEPVAIKVIMQKAMKGGLAAKVANGKADNDEKKELIALFTDLNKQDPPAGDAKEFRVRTSALLKAAKDDDGKALKKAMDCKSCHSNYKTK